VSLIWHIVKKDFRRMAWPVAAWWLFIVMSAGWFAHGASLGSITTKWEAEAWIVTVRWLTLLAAIIKELLGYLLVGATVLEDPINGTTGFWQTRPLSSGRLFVAKGVGVIGFLVLVPTLLMVPIWLAFGFDRETAFFGVAPSVLAHSLIALTGLAIASLSANLRQFLFLSIALPAAYVLCAAWYTTHAIATEYTLEVRWSRDAIVLFGVIPITAGIMSFQYLSRNTVRSLWLVALALVACLAVRVVWPWNIMPYIRPLLRAEMRQQRPEVSADAEISDPSTLTLQLNMPLRADGVFVPYPRSAYLEPERDVRLAFLGAPWLKEDVVERLALGESVAANRWRISAFVPNRRSIPIESVRGQIVCDVALAELRRYPPMSISVGATTSDDSSQARIECVMVLPDRSRVLIVRDREAMPSWFFWYSRPLLPYAVFHTDEYVAVDTEHRRSKTCRANDIESVGFAGMAIGYQEIAIPQTNVSVDSIRDAVLVKLRFVPRSRSLIGATSLSVPFEATKGMSLDDLEKGAH
jgi:hypothetical protein